MSDDILPQLKDSLMKSEVSALQLHEWTILIDIVDIQGKAQLLANIRYIENNSIQENFLFCSEIPAYYGDEIYHVTATFFEEEEVTV